MRKHPIVYLLPLLLLHLVVILLFADPDLIGDEGTYLRYAKNLSEGFYSPRDNPEVAFGPGYPMFLVPFVLAGVPLIIPTLFNAIFIVGGVYFFYRTLRLFHFSDRTALIGSYLLGIYPPLFRWSYVLYTESMTFFFVCASLFFVSRFLRQKEFNYSSYLPAIISLAILTYTKFYFNFVTMVSVVVVLAGFVLFRNRNNFKALSVLIGSFCLFSPFLIYMYFLTGKVLYTSTHGGKILYHRATPFDGEYGNYFPNSVILDASDKSDVAKGVYSNIEELSKNHRAFYEEIEHLSYMKRDSAFKRKAKAYMFENPKKYLKNTIANTGRLFFHFPFSYRREGLGPYGYLIPNMFLVVFSIIGIYPAILGRRRIPYELLASILFVCIYLGGLILLLGKGRNLIAAVPILLLFILYVKEHILDIKIKTQPNG